MEISENTSVVISKVDEAEADEMRSFVESKANQRWLWHAIDLRTGTKSSHTLSENVRTKSLSN